jgi:UDP-glucuronate 4-epimerase
MAVWLFTEAVFNRKPLRLFKNGDLYRDFTFIDDIVSGVLAVLNGPPNGPLPHKVYNIGNNKPEKVTRLIEILEAETGLKAEIFVEPLQPGDVEKTAADIDAINSAFGFEPSTSLDVGLPIFIDWYRQYRGL